MPDTQELRDEVTSLVNQRVRYALACRGGGGDVGGELEVPEPDGTDVERSSKRR
jgi:hypothetical protein